MSKKIHSLYLHYPFCKHLCNYCDFFKKVPVNSEVEIDQYHDYLEKSIIVQESLMEKHGYSWGELDTLYIGGGTPSLWGEKGAQYLKNFLKVKSITLSNNCEFTLEVNPGAWTEESLKAWEVAGVNRYSLGIQSLNDHIIKYLDRVHSIDDVYTTLEYFHKNQKNFSVDFMLGLPNSEELNRSVLDELTRALDYNPSHFSVYILTVKENYKHFKSLPTEEWVEREYLEVARYLKENKFSHYEVSNFALLNKESKHNLMYWKSETVAALGPSATGFLKEARLRYKWKTKEAEIEEEILSEEAFRLEQIYMALRSKEGLVVDNFKNLNEYNFIKQKWNDQKYLLEAKEKILLNSEGYLVLDSLMDDLFRL